MKSLHEFIVECGSFEEAARSLGLQLKWVYRYHERTHVPSPDALEAFARYGIKWPQDPIEDDPSANVI